MSDFGHYLCGGLFVLKIRRMQDTDKQISYDDVVATANSSYNRVLTQSRRILDHIQKNGMAGIMIFKTEYEETVYWLLGQKVEEDKWNVSLLNPKTTFRCSMGDKTDGEFITLLNDIDSETKAVLMVEALDIVPVTPDNLDFKFKHLSKQLEKKVNKIWPFN